ncbi:hypothetical protein RJ640_028114 [Escallonia rubra]|uniref:Protein LYK2 n=1 Tax=Escallonia rubra TaxID=112253 RepID=A0AA88RNW0_9ASTE|nr:hypothetical protein RJ640_028114 [Escallonia rubra]
MVSKLQVKALVEIIFCMWVAAPALGQSLLSCDAASSDASVYRCDERRTVDQCSTFAMLRANSYFSSLFNLSSSLGINRFLLAEANGFCPDTEFLPKDQPLLIPIDCKCKAGISGADLTKTTVKGDSFYGISQSLEGLTTCKAIVERNPSVSPWGTLGDKVQLLIPLRCSCPSSSELRQGTRILLSYPVREGDTVSNLAKNFYSTPETIISVNRNRSGASFRPESLAPLSTILIPLKGKPKLAKPREPKLGYSSNSIPVIIKPPKKKSKMRQIVIYIAISAIAFGASIAIVVTFLVIHWKRKKRDLCKTKDVELQQLSLSVRTASEKKVSFEGSQDPFDAQIIETTPHKMVVEAITLEELKKATEDFNSNNLIEDSVFHGRLNGKNLAIKFTKKETLSKIDFSLFHDAVHHHPNIIRLLGTGVTDQGPDSFLVFEYARNGSLKDWLHGGLAMKSQFIASCYCFLTWNQRLRICLDVATALQYMHHIMIPSYVHRNIKSRNIFLDEEFNAKVGNFGMARCGEGDDGEEHGKQASSSHPASWSIWYLAPEYVHQGTIAPTIDIFSFGVVLLEVLSGQPPISRSNQKGDKNVLLTEKIKSILQSENAEELREWMDNALGDNYSFDAAVTVANLARACVEDDPSLRPNAGEIVEKLARLVEELPEGEQFTVCESSCKPLVNAAANHT